MSRREEMKKRSVNIAGHRTSVSLEEIYWEALKGLADARGLSINQLVVQIDAARSVNLSSAIRVHLFEAALAGEIAPSERGDSEDRDA